MNTFNPFNILLDFFNVLADFSNLVYNFLFQEISIGTWKFQPFFVVGSSVIITLIIARIIKLLIPGA